MQAIKTLKLEVQVVVSTGMDESELEEVLRNAAGNAADEIRRGTLSKPLEMRATVGIIQANAKEFWRSFKLTVKSAV